MNSTQLSKLIRQAPVRRAGDDAEFPILSMTMRDGLVDQADKFKKRVASTDTSTYKVVKRGQLVVGFPIDEAVLAFQRVHPEGIVSPAYAVWDADESIVDINYLERFLRGLQAIRYYKSKLRGSTARRRSLPNPVFLKMEVPLPPLPEQRRIASILDQADALRAKRRETLKSLDDYVWAMFEGEFGAPIGASERWPVRELGEVTLKISDGTHHSPPITKSGIPYVTAKHLKKHGLDFDSAPWFISEADHRAIYSRCDPKPGDVLYIKDGATTGIAAVNRYAFEFSMLSSLALIRPDLQVITPEYLTMWLNHPRVSGHLLGGMSGAAIKRLTLAKIKKFAIPVPPLRLQRGFAESLAAIDRLRYSQQQHLSHLDELFASFQHRAFQGEL